MKLKNQMGVVHHVLLQYRISVGQPVRRFRAQGLLHEVDLLESSIVCLTCTGLPLLDKEL